MQDPREAELQREVERKREELLARAEVVRRSAVSLLDPRESFRRHPVGGILLSLAAGVVLTSLGGGILRGQDRESPPRAPRNPFQGLVDAIVPDLIGAVIGPIVAALLGGLQPCREEAPPPGPDGRP